MFIATHVPFTGCDLFLDVFGDRGGLFRELLGKPGGRGHHEQPNDDQRKRRRQVRSFHPCLDPSLQRGEDQCQRTSPDQGWNARLGQAVAQVDANRREQRQSNRPNASARPPSIPAKGGFL